MKKVAGKWEFFYGGDVPAREGAIAELTLNTIDINDERFKERVTQEVLIRILEEGTPLWVALSDRTCPTSSKLKQFANGLPPGATRVEEVRLGPLKNQKTEKQLELAGLQGKGGLWLKVKGLERCELQTGTVTMPADFEARSAISLNHAFTMLSERYETHRLSHTGNVYDRFFYQEANGKGYPLDDLRAGVLASVERTLLQTTWAEIEKQLGWRPVLLSKKSKGK